MGLWIDCKMFEIDFFVWCIGFLEFWSVIRRTANAWMNEWGMEFFLDSVQCWEKVQVT